LEKKLSITAKEKLLQDVDSSLIQTYMINGKRLTVINDVMLGVFIRAELDLDQIFAQNGDEK
jgi:hypothetical protein